MDTDKIKGFFANHIEKMILTVVIGVSGYLIYQGIQKPNFLDEEQPQRLSQQATQVKGEIDADHTDAVLEERKEALTFDIVRETEKLYTAVEPSQYKLPRTWEGKTLESVIRRQDPVLVAPTSIELTPVATAIAKRARTTSTEPQYPLFALEDADEVEKVEKKTRQSRRSRRRSGGMDDDMMMGGMEEDMMMDMMMGEQDMMEMGEGPDEESTGAGRKFDTAFDFGFRPVQTDDKRLPEPTLGRFIVGRAVVPHKELYANFELALADATEYTPARDTPYYYGFQVQRADVTDKTVDQLDDADWVDVWDRLRYTTLAGKYWSGFAPEIVPEDYRDNALTMWIPPVLLDDYQSWAKHPLIPELSKSELRRLANEDETIEDFDEFDIDSALENTTLSGPGERNASGMMGEMMGMDMDMGMGMDMDMDMEMGGGMNGMEMGMMMGMSGRGVEVDPVEYKLIRFYDFAGIKNGPQPGRKYVYRLRYSVVDPNFPFSETQQPQTKYLAPEVATRVQGLMQQAAAANSRKDLFQRWSDWSEPSAPASLPSLEHYYVGPVERGPITMTTVGGKQVEYPRNQPKAKLLASQYDPATGARVPVELDVTEGTVLSKELESADVVDPISLAIKKMPNPKLVSGTTVVDIGGAESLKITNGLASPGLMLLYDQTGKLVVTDEVEDQLMYRIYTYAEERGVE